jgi:pSer/pThr/pTyr-binding forkhead associated (FHA) protein
VSAAPVAAPVPAALREAHPPEEAPASAQEAPAPVQEDPAPEPEEPAPAPAAAQVVVTADRAYFEVVRAAGGPDSGLIEFPDYCPDRRFTLSGSQLLIGRRSRSRGINPEIDLTGPPEDPGVSHAHALLLPHAAGGWAVVDLGSANGTYVNDPNKPIPVRVPVPVKPGDRVFAGAWTVLMIT